MIIVSVDKMENRKEISFNVRNIITRSPRLDTILMVEKFIKEHSGDLKKTELFNSLPKKMMWGTFNVILEYLYKNNKIGVDRNGYIIYIWNPELIERLKNKKRY